MPFAIRARPAATLVETAIADLRRDILTGAVTPGSRLRIEDLREKYSISASPLREALSRLVASGLVTSQGQKGFRVAPVSKDDYRDVTETRKLFERAALSESIRNGDAAWEARIVACFERLDREHTTLQATSGETSDAWELANEEFHEALVAACTSARILQFRRTIYDQAARYRRLIILEPETKSVGQEEHREMMHAALARDIKRSCRLAATHADRNYDMMVRLFSE